MTPEKLVVIGASAGGVQALQAVVRDLPRDLSAAVMIVLHLPSHHDTQLPSILRRVGSLPVQLVQDGQELRSGVITIAPPDRHLVVQAGRLRLTAGPRENRVRPCIDVLFRSAALEFGPAVVGVVLSGLLDDGTAGLWAIKDQGGITIVQEPSDAEYDSMPASAIAHVAVDCIAPADQIGAEIVRSVARLAGERAAPAPQRMDVEVQSAINGDALRRGIMELGEISPNTCPECQGVLVKFRDGSITRYRCHTGHGYSKKTLLVDVDATIESTLWSAIRAIEERALLLKEMASDASSEPDASKAKMLEDGAKEAAERAQKVRDVLVASGVRTEV